MAPDRCERDEPVGLDVMVGRGVGDVERIHLAARDRECGVVAALVTEHDLAIELEAFAGEGGAVGQAVDRAARGPSPFLANVYRLGDRLDLEMRPDGPQRWRCAQSRDVAELAEVVARALLIGQLRERRSG